MATSFQALRALGDAGRSSDSQASFPAAHYTFTSGSGDDNGIHTFSSTILETAGTQSITATDTADSLSASQTGIVVSANTAASIVVASYPTATTAGAAQIISRSRAYDVYGNAAAGFTGTASP